MSKMEEQEKYIDIIKEIATDFRIMKNIRPLKQSEVNYFYDEFSITASHNSNAIEGNTFTYDETRLLLKEGVTSSARSYKEHEEIVGYKQAFDFLYKALKESRKVTEDFIKELHSYVLRGNEEAGSYRTIQNYIGDMFNVTYTPCSPSVVPKKMKSYVEELQKDMEKYVSIKEQEEVDWVSIFHSLAKHHIEFEKIHPFIDGNGRSGRLLLTYEIISMGLLPIDIRYEERTRYYSALSSYDDKAKYSINPTSKTDKMAKLIAESELRSMKVWISIFGEITSGEMDESDIEIGDK